MMIMGVVYSLAINNFSKLSDDSMKVTLQTLKEYLIHTPHEKSAKLLCLDDCSSCDVFVDGVKSSTIEDFLDDGVVTYRYEFAYGFVRAEPEVYFNKDDVEENVCFSYMVDENGIGDQALVEYKDKFYDYSSHLSETQVYNSISEARNAKDDFAKEVTR